MDTKTLSAYEKNKPAIYKWRELNKEKYNDICNKAQAIYYQKNKDNIRKNDIKILCEHCNRYITKSNISKHNKTSKHLKNMQIIL